MPVVKKLTPDEVAELKLRSFDPAAKLREEYDALLADVNIGDFGSLDLDEDEQPRTKQIRTMLQHAATRKGIRLTFKGMIGKDRLIFEAVPRTTGEGIGAYKALREYSNPTPSAPPIEEAPVAEAAPEVEAPSSVPVSKRKPGRPMKVPKVS